MDLLQGNVLGEDIKSPSSSTSQDHFLSKISSFGRYPLEFGTSLWTERLMFGYVWLLLSCWAMLSSSFVGDVGAAAAAEVNRGLSKCVTKLVQHPFAPALLRFALLNPTMPFDPEEAVAGAGWTQCQKMLNEVAFLKSLARFLDEIDNLPKERLESVQKCIDLLGDAFSRDHLERLSFVLGMMYPSRNRRSFVLTLWHRFSLGRLLLQCSCGVQLFDALCVSKRLAPRTLGDNSS